MSGVRETPRQKMIGMMYLFYTALLALQVDTAILEKFTLINKTLEHQIVEINAANQKLFGGIESSVQDKGNRPNDKKVLDKASKVRKETITLISELESIKKDMIEISGGLTENGALVGATDQDAFSIYMIHQKNGRILKKRLNVYASMLGVETSSLEDFPPIAKDAIDYDEFKDDHTQNQKNFSQLFFENTPVGAGLSSMSQLQSEILQYETKALQLLGELVGIKDIDFDQVFPLIRPESNIVAVGGKYIAEMFIAASSSAFSPEMAVDGKEIPLDTMAIGNSSIKFGRVEFTVSSGGTSVPGTPYKRKTFIAEITLADSVYRDTVEYFTIQPVMQISSRALSALWKNCANDLSVQVPALGNAYNPFISTTNADKIMRQGRGNITIIPTSNRSVKMTVSNAGMVIGTETFRVKNIPLPSYSFKLGNTEIDMENGISANAVRGRLTIEVLAEANFKQDVPNDARYRVERVEVTLRVGTTPKSQIKENSGRVNLRKIQQATPRSGNVLTIKITRVGRRNFRGDRDPVAARALIWHIPIH